MEQVFLETKPIRGLINCCFYDQEINLYEKSFDKDRIKKFIDHEAMFRGSLWNFISLLWNDHSGLDKTEKVHTNFMIFCSQITNYRVGCAVSEAVNANITKNFILKHLKLYREEHEYVWRYRCLDWLLQDFYLYVFDLCLESYLKPIIEEKNKRIV